MEWSLHVDPSKVCLPTFLFGFKTGGRRGWIGLHQTPLELKETEELPIRGDILGNGVMNDALILLASSRAFCRVAPR